MNRVKKEKSAIRKLMKLIRKYYKWLIIAAIAAVLEVIVSICFAKVLSVLTDSAISKNKARLVHYFAFGLIVVLADMSVKYIKTYCIGRFTENSMLDIRQKYFNHAERISLKFLNNNQSGDLLSRFSNDLRIIQSFLQYNIIDLLSIPLKIIIFSIALLIINWKLTIFTYILIPFFIILIMVISKPVEKYMKEQQEELGKANSLVQEYIAGLDIIKAFTLEKTMSDKYRIAVNNSVIKGIKAAINYSITIPLGILLQYSPFIFTLTYGGYLCVKGEVTYGLLIEFMQILIYTLTSLTNFPNVIAGLRATSGAAERVYEIFDGEEERNTGEKYKITEINEVITFENVNFSYKKDHIIFNNLCFNIKKGENVAIVGPSGSGKSTILKLIAGFYCIDSGTIKVYGNDIYKCKLSELRNILSVVSQDSYLFPVSLYTNISYGKYPSNKEEVISASKLAGIHDFIESLPEGYNTLVGEKGALLSGGQRQRISIARAILKKAPILLLDEATSALDSESEQVVLKSIEGIGQNITTIIVTHRLSTIVNADKILVVNGGQIVEAGTHQELFKEGTLYSQLYLKQFHHNIS